MTDVVDVDGAPGLVMEFIRGPALDDFLEQKKLTSRQADKLVVPILDGVAAAHGLGLIDDLVLFPHARDRLRLGDHERVGALARRFAPATCVALERGAWLVREADGWHSRGPHGSASILHEDGVVRPVEA